MEHHGIYGKLDSTWLAITTLVSDHTGRTGREEVQALIHPVTESGSAPSLWGTAADTGKRARLRA